MASKIPTRLILIPLSQKMLEEKLSMRHFFTTTLATFAIVFLSILSFSAALPTPSIIVAPRIHDGSVSSTNWSGFAVTGSAGSVSDAKGSWVVPTIQGNCPSTNQYSSFWVGIDGYSSGTVEQTGTDSDCQNGVPTYYAWYEFFPHPSFLINGISVHPGDVISAEAHALGNGKFTVSISDTTTGQSFSPSQWFTGHNSLQQNGSPRHPRATVVSSACKLRDSQIRTRQYRSRQHLLCDDWCDHGSLWNVRLERSKDNDGDQRRRDKSLTLEPVQRQH